MDLSWTQQFQIQCRYGITIHLRRRHKGPWGSGHHNLSCAPPQQEHEQCIFVWKSNYCACVPPATMIRYPTCNFFDVLAKPNRISIPDMFNTVGTPLIIVVFQHQQTYPVYHTPHFNLNMTASVARANASSISPK